MTLILWLLLAPNVSDFFLPDMDNEDEQELALQLNELIKKDERMRSIIDNARQVNFYWLGDSKRNASEIDMYSVFARIFPKARLWCV